MTNADYTAIKVLVDKSGSMAHIAKDMSDALRGLINAQKALPGKCSISLDDFSSDFGAQRNPFNQAINTGYTVNGHRNVYKSVDVNEAPDYTLEASGGTALNDAWVRAIEEFGTELRNLKEEDRPGHVLFVVITDGEENSSRQYRKEDVKARVEEQTNKYGWTFVYLGANLDAVQEGGSYGIARGSTLTYAATSDGVATASASLSNYASGVRLAGSSNFSEQDRTDAVTPKSKSK